MTTEHPPPPAAPAVPARASSGPARRSRRDRHGRGMRGPMAHQPVPLARTRAEQFDDVVLQVVQRLSGRAAGRLDDVEFAVEEVPFDEEAIAEEDALRDGDVLLSRLYRSGLDPAAADTDPCIVVYRRPLEVRANHAEDLADLVAEVLVEQAARLLDVDPDELDPPPS